MSVFKDLWWFFKSEKKAYAFGVILLAFVALLELVPPMIVGKTVDFIADGQVTTTLLVQLMLILLISALVVYGLRYLWRIMIFGASVRLARLLRNNLYKHFTKMSPNFYQRKRVGDLMAHSTNDIQAIQQTAGAGVLTLVDSVMTGGFVIIAMATTISWKLTLICLIPLPFMAISTNYYGTLLHKTFHKAQAAFSSLNDKVQESVNGIKVIKTFGQEKEDIEEFEKQSNDVVKKNITVAKIDSLFDPTIGLIVGISFFLAVSFGSYFVVNEEMTIGQLVAFTTYLGLLVWPMLAFGWLFNIVERGRASYDRVTALLKEEVDIEDIKDAKATIPTGDIEYNLKDFYYPTKKEVVLENIHFQLRQGETLGIVGKTGSGKTTLLKLLIREFDGYDGEITIGNQSIKYFQLDYLRQAIGYVPQDHFLFSSTVSDNISFAVPTASYNDIINAAKLANIHEDIVQFTEGYETIVGERGVSLSGGQKQRISIARALLMNPEILILDDSLSAVDAKTEETILSALKRERLGKTTIITSHRLSAIQHANIILVLDEGKIVQIGTHDELMKEEGWYKDMYHRQQLESLVEHGG
ncbi:ABC transporter transmembrane domain-containing protein [Sutcliffiella cohnii]|uniref:Multidrug ABC transporter permease/ATP-binding protein n=1 Tax=Sutcliffiella cohnii TaxID=33932 RepID=A0A223KRA7_9BACI|nr:ABC transporter transmembrane domain-containing protein [Sutcliffiella cohnii]AST91966.1 multidrug ABC transporter permease/ATP-binding protein [Sutcliffiella cohnii]MED4015246.1 ABC transporter transmembrane domain-containing protein [Sutcliffiella cohnii]